MDTNASKHDHDTRAAYLMEKPNLDSNNIINDISNLLRQIQSWKIIHVHRRSVRIRQPL